MIKAAFFDIDNTIYDHRNGRWDKDSLEGIKEIQRKGVKVFLATARPYASFVPFGALNLGIEWDGYIASSGGLAVTDGKTVFKTLVKKEDVGKFISLCQYFHLTMEFVGTKERKLFAPLTKCASNYYEIYHDIIPEIDGSFSDECIALLLFDTKKHDAFFKRTFPNLCFYRFLDTAVDIYEVPHRKGDGIVAILKYYGFKKDEAVAFGDDLQDISMASEAGTFVAMGNAKDEVKKVSSFVTKPVWEEGVLGGLKTLHLL